ncbi:MAG: ParB/RepB/Spo0J family partition protein, partial [Kiloniellaceae bacterium]
RPGLARTDARRHTQDHLAKTVGKSRSHVANTMRLLNLPDPVKELLGQGALSAGHARALLGAPDPAALARTIVARDLNVRQTERLVRAAAGRGQALAPAAAPGRAGPASTAPGAKDPDTVALERDLTALLGLKVTITFAGEGGSLTIHYQTLEQLDDVLRRLNQAPDQGAA